jgi:CelD/BcsL family acetyltransferase involved in cellulose biosynthesis
MQAALASGELDLLRITSPRGVVGLLYNLRYRGVVYAYQSALSDPSGQPHAKPGLTCHTLAIRRALGQCHITYDFLAGDQRYKRSLSDGAATLSWAELARPWSLRALLARLRR